MSQKRRINISFVATPLISISLALLLGTLLLILLGYNPFETFFYLIFGTMTPSKIANTLFNTTPLLLTGLSVAVAFRGGMFNIGSEGQMIFGGFITALVGFSLGMEYNIKLPSIIMIPLLLIAGMVGGALWAAIPGILKAKRGVHEVISTIMMNNIAALLMIYFVGDIDSPFIDKGSGQGNITPQTPKIAESGFIDRIADTFYNTPLRFLFESFKNSPLHWGLIIGILTCFIIYIILWKTKFGYETRAVGFNQKAAKYGGINVSRNIIMVMMLCGALGGLAGALEVMGFWHRYVDGFSAGYGFDGIAVSLLGGNHPLGVLFGAGLFGWLTTGGQVLQLKGIPKDIANTIKGFIVFLVAVPLIAKQIISFFEKRHWNQKIKQNTGILAKSLRNNWLNILIGIILVLIFSISLYLIPVIAIPLQSFGNSLFAPLSTFFSQFSFFIPIVDFLETIFSIKLYLNILLFSITLITLYKARKNALNLNIQRLLLIFAFIFGLNEVLILYLLLGQHFMLFALISIIFIFIIYQELQARGNNTGEKKITDKISSMSSLEQENDIKKYGIIALITFLWIFLTILTIPINLPFPIDIFSFFTLKNWGAFFSIVGIFFILISLYIVSRLKLPQRHPLFYIMSGIRILYSFVSISIIFELNTPLLYNQTLQMATPIGFAALGGMYSEKSGVVNIGLEGKILTGAFVSVWISQETGDPWLGVLGAAIAGGLMGLLHAIASVRYRADQVVVGVAINLLASALTTLGLVAVWNIHGTSPTVRGFQNIKLGFLTEIPVIGDFFYQLAGGDRGFPPLVIAFIATIIISAWIIQRTAFGLRVRAVGEHPRAADTLGINVYRTRYICVIISGVLAALGGAQLTLGTVPLFRRDMSGGRGFVALASLIFGAWTPIGAALASILFAFSYAFIFQLNIKLEQLGTTWLFQMQKLTPTLPFVITLLTVATVAKRARPPAADGIPYVKEG